MKLAASLASIGLALVAPALSAQEKTLHVVDIGGGPGSRFQSIQAAIDASVDGDAILVRAGAYAESLVIDDRSLILTAEAGDVVTVQGLVARNISLGKVLYFLGIDVQGGGMLVADNPGAVWLEDGDHAPGPSDDFQIRDSAAVVVTRTRIDPAGVGVTPLRIERARVHLTEARLLADQAPAVGLEVVDGEIFLGGGLVRGGRGANGSQPPVGPCVPATPGAPAVRASGAASELEVLGAQLDGGRGGTGTGAACPDAPDGQPVELSGGTLTNLPGTSPWMLISSPVRVGETVTLTIFGDPGDVVWLAHQAAEPPTPGLTFALFSGWLLIQPPLLGFLGGVVPATGRLVLSAQVPDIFDGDFVGGPGQILVLSATRGFLAGGPGAMLLLDPAF